MPPWKSTLNVVDLLHAHKKGRMKIDDVGREIAARIRANPLVESTVLQDIAEDFDKVRGPGTYNNAMSRLTAFGQREHRIRVVRTREEE